MRILTFSKRVSVVVKYGSHSEEISCNPGERLIFADENVQAIQQDPGNERYIDSINDLTPYLSELNSRRPAHWRKKRVLFYRNRGIGDQLIMSAASRFFTEMLGAQCYQATNKVHEPIWSGNPNLVGAAICLPLHLDIIYRKDPPAFLTGAFMFESLSEWDSDSEQPNVYDRLFAMLGFDPARVPPKFKRPSLYVIDPEIEYCAQFLKQITANRQFAAEKGYIILQVQATNKVRSLPDQVIEMALLALCDYARKVEIPVLVIDDKPLSPTVAELVKRHPNAVDISNKIPSVRLLISLIHGATTLVGPDSAGLHIAAAFEVPAVGLWGPFSPASRCAYYPRQIHLFHPERCANAPCYNYAPDLPVMKCPKGAHQKHCEVFEGITSEEIFEAVKNVNC